MDSTISILIVGGVSAVLGACAAAAVLRVRRLTVPPAAGVESPALRPGTPTQADSGASDASAAIATPPTAMIPPALPESIQELERRRQTLEAAERYRNLLISQLSHDVRTPLNSIITLSELMRTGNCGPLAPDQRKYVEVIHRSGKGLLSLINDVLDLSHLEAGRLELEIATVDVRSVIRGVAAAGAELARGKGLPLHLNPPRTSLLVRADEDRLRQVLARLIEHAVKETTNGYVEVSADGDDRQVTIRVSDTGPGAIPELRGAHFDVLLTQKGGMSPAPGLLLAERLVKGMGGTMTFDSAPGEGTTVVVSLPGSTEDVPSPGLEEAARTSTRADVPAHVLLIEDDEIERGRIAALLQDSGYRVSPAASGQEGLNQLLTGRFDGVVLDLVMPGMSGLDVLRAAKADERLSTLPFVVLSALYMTRSEREVLGPTVAAVVRKGEDTGDELLAHLARALAARGKTAPTVVFPSAAPERLARVLLVEDDDDDNLFAIEQILASLPVTIETAATGQRAIEICRRRPPDLILMDVELPGLAGLDPGYDIRRLPDCADIPIIALTGAAGNADRDRALAAGGRCSDCLSKPVKPRDVVSAVTRALQLGIH